MNQAPDAGWIVFGLLLLGLFGWYFWHTIHSMFAYARALVDLMDTRSARLRQRIDHEAKYGVPPLWYRAAQKLIITIIIAGAAALVWVKFRSA